SSRDCVARGRKRQHRGQDGSDARRPAERKRKSEKEATPNAGLRAGAAQMHVTIQPTRKRGPKKSDDGKGKKVHCSKSREQRPVAHQRRNTERNQNHTENNS